ncbi:pentatricopeptide repeat-containing protein At1g09900-like isoform X3 [Lycium barbarum]|uniref:pentatricopeptide repeat-containing protein At1g09900-like isoform X3 n=1 Tax=Lycium barbarum TaxID=112863 RepID=UPI00293F175A|nr:pentatricopeptide repeat-containing protein At1g09900-like isoform X3 [Lycium barbarum]
MGPGMLPRKSSFNLLFKGQIMIKEKSLCRKYYYGASSVPLLYDPDKAVVLPIRKSHSCKGRKLYSVVVRVCKSLSWEVAKEIPFKRTLKKYGLSHSINAYSMMIDTFAFAGMDMEVHTLLKQMIFDLQKAGVDLLKVTYLNNTTGSTLVADALIKVFAANKLLDHAIDVVNQVKKMGLEPSIYSCNYLLKCLAEASRGENLVTLFEAMKTFGPSPNVRTYTIMMNFYCTNHSGQQPKVDIKEAYKILKEMWEIHISPSAATYSVWVRGLCRVGCPDVALKFIRMLRYENQPLNSYCYNAIIHGFCAEGEVKKAISVFEEMSNSGITPDICSYSILVDGFCKFESIDGGLCLIQGMQENNIKPTPISYSSILKGLCEIGAAKIANDCFHDLTNSGCKVDQTAYDILITGFCAQGDLSSAHELLEEMINNHLAPDASIYERLIRASCHAGSADTAMKYRNMMVQGGYLPDTVTCNFIVKQYCTDGHVMGALNLIDEMMDQGIVPNLYTYNVVINQLCKDENTEEREGRVLEALHLIDEMVDQGIVPDLYTYNVVVHKLCKDINAQKALEGNAKT